MKRIYLDHAATSWPKPEAVYAAMDDYQRRVGASAGRGAYASARDADRVLTGARAAVAQALGEPDPSRVAFTTSGTDALSTAIFGLLRPGDHVVTTVTEHNAVLRPLAELASGERGTPIRVDWVGCDARGVVDPSAVEAAMRDDTRLVIVNHASNVTGAIQDVAAIAQEAHLCGALVLVDAAQSLGKVPIDVGGLRADLLAGPGHKGLLGPQGTGVLWVRGGVEHEIRPLRYGGVAIHGAARRQPGEMPYRLEAGTLNVAALAGLKAGLDWLLQRSIREIAARTEAITQRLHRELSAVESVRFVAEAAPSSAGVVTFNLDDYDPPELAALLEQLAGVECRAGLHCAPRLHEALGSSGGVRLSVGATTDAGEVEAAVSAVRQLAATSVV
ncbi:MAG: aminotransferase class V-fold PLP-dependent enzyme [Planctomycetota bacterium]